MSRPWEGFLVCFMNTFRGGCAQRPAGAEAAHSPIAFVQLKSACELLDFDFMSLLLHRAAPSTPTTWCSPTAMSTRTAGPTHTIGRWRGRSQRRRWRIELGEERLWRWRFLEMRRPRLMRLCAGGGDQTAAGGRRRTRGCDWGNGAAGPCGAAVSDGGGLALHVTPLWQLQLQRGPLQGMGTQQARKKAS